MKVLFASPTYGPVDPGALRYQRAAIMHAAAHGVEWAGDVSPDRMKFDAARNTVVVAALESEADAVFWCDSDVVLPVDAITRLVAEQKDFITGMYFQRYPPHFPLVAHFDDRRQTFNWLIEWPEQCVAPIDGCGFGCVVTSTALLRALRGEEPGGRLKPWFTFEKFSEDFDFCLKAARAGFQLYVHTGVQCGHLADPRPVTVTDFVAQGARHGAVRPTSAA